MLPAMSTGKVSFRDFNEFAIGQIVHCDHHDPSINKTAQSPFHAHQKTDKIRPCLLVGFDVPRGKLRLAPMTTFTGSYHPGWHPIAGYIDNNDDSYAIWIGRPSFTNVILNNRKMRRCLTEGVPPQSTRNVFNYNVLRDRYIQAWGKDDTKAYKYYQEQKKLREPSDSHDQTPYQQPVQSTSHGGGYTAQSSSHMATHPGHGPYNNQQPMYAPGHGSTSQLQYAQPHQQTWNPAQSQPWYPPQAPQQPTQEQIAQQQQGYLMQQFGDTELLYGRKRDHETGRDRFCCYGNISRCVYHWME
ncbi:hypothetical protein C8R47DRAFT_1170546 [Mycena vitilis]|nr:hypothetical protein C8R47DRAFT_1170546 [Mycena vitilis]